MYTKKRINSGQTTSYPPSKISIPTLSIGTDRYEACFASTHDELDRIQRLRFEVFNLEMNEGRERSYRTGRDRDQYDRWMHHLYVRDRSTSDIVGTYRLQHRQTAERGIGFYSDSEFKISDYAPEVVAKGIEIGRACVHEDHRSGTVLNLLWKGIATYMKRFNKEYIFGCTSLPTQSKKKASLATNRLQKKGYYHDRLLIPVKDPYRFTLPSVDENEEIDSALPRLLLVYIRYGAKVSSLPALDSEFQTIDFLTIFDLDNLPESARRRFFQ